MVNPRVKCKVEPSPHAKVRMADRSLSQSDIERIVRGGVWIAEGGTDYDVTYQRWHIKVKTLQCLIRVKTVFMER